MPKKQPVLRDRVMSAGGIYVDHELLSNHTYFLGRDPLKEDPNLDPEHVIRILQGYNPKRHHDEKKDRLGLSVSRLQGILEVDAGGYVKYTQQSENSRTHLVKRKEISKDDIPVPYEALMALLPKFLDIHHEIYPGCEEQIFIGDFLVLGNNYPMEYIENVDTESEKTAEEELRSDTTVIVKTPEELLKRK